MQPNFTTFGRGPISNVQVKIASGAPTEEGHRTVEITTRFRCEGSDNGSAKNMAEALAEGSSVTA